MSCFTGGAASEGPDTGLPAVNLSHAFSVQSSRWRVGSHPKTACDPYSPGQRAVGGGVLGAGTGAAVGGLAGGHAGTGAAIGGGLGAITGAAVCH